MPVQDTGLERFITAEDPGDLAFDEGTMLRIAWAAADETMSGLDSAVTFTLAPGEPARACS